MKAKIAASDPSSLSVQLLRFLTTGVANTAVGLGTIFLLKWALDVGDVPANFAGYSLGLCLSFMLNRNWTFAHRGALAPAMLRFLSVFAVAYLSNVAALLLLRDRLGVNAYLAHMLAVAPYTIVFFVGSRWFAFRSSLVTRQ